MITKLKFKFVVINLMMVTAVMLIAFYCNYVFTQSKMFDESIESLERTIKKQAPDDLTSIYVFVDNNDVLYKKPGYENFEPKEMVNAALQSKSNIGELKNSEFNEFRYLKVPDEVGYHIAFRSTFEEKTALKNLMRFSTITTCGCVFILLLISIYLAHLATQPIAETFEKQKQLIADASHELKTPITAIIASSDVLISDGNMDEENKAWVKSIKTSAEDMSFLVNDMLSLANTESTDKKTQLSPLNISDLVMTVALNYEAIFYEIKKNFTYHADPNLLILGNDNSLKQLIKIFLDNAGKYSDANGTVSLTLRQDQERAIITVYNSGPPIPQEEIPRIFERFYRVDKSRTSTSGSGLGLAIAKKIAEEHSTRIGVVSDYNGTYFSTEFKLIKQ